MVSDQLLAQTKYEEGFRSTPYLCTGGKRTIGHGRNLDADPYFEGNLIPDKLSEQEAEIILVHDLSQAEKRVAAAWHGFELLQGARRDAVVQMVFQLELDGFLGFKMLRHWLIRSEWQKAYDEALNSKWARSDSPARAERVAHQILTGKYYPVPSQGILR